MKMKLWYFNIEISVVRIKVDFGQIIFLKKKYAGDWFLHCLQIKKPGHISIKTII